HLIRLFLFKLRPPPRPTLFPYTTLFRSHHAPSSGTGHLLQLLVGDGRGLRTSLATPLAALSGSDLHRGHPWCAAHHGYSVVLFLDRKSTRLNSSHVKISYAVFCLKKKNV